MNYGEFLNKLKESNLHVTNTNGVNSYKDFRLSIFDTEGFNYEVMDIIIDEETKRIIFMIKDAVIFQI